MAVLWCCEHTSANVHDVAMHKSRDGSQVEVYMPI